jgi:3-oxoadipate enol-lactonase
MTNRWLCANPELEPAASPETPGVFRRSLDCTRRSSVGVRNADGFLDPRFRADNTLAPHHPFAIFTSHPSTQRSSVVRLCYPHILDTTMTQASAPDWFVHDEGEGHAVLLLHGLPSPPAEMLELGRRLGGRLLVPHLPGYDRSRAVRGPHTVAAIEDGLVRLLQDRHATNALLIGFSMGAYRALSLALREEIEPHALVLLSGFAEISSEERAGFGAFAAALRAGVDLHDQAPPRFLSPASQLQPERTAAVRAWLDLASPEVLAAELDDVTRCPSLTSRLGEITCKTLVRTGALDVAAPPHHAEALAAGIRGAGLAIVPEVAHAQWLEDADALERDIGLFLAFG